MIVDLDETQTLPFDPHVVVLGAGAVGIMLAVALARRGVKVLLCESGGRRVEPDSQALNDAVVVGRRHAGIAEGRARLLGGTTTLWGGQLIAFQDIDFEPRPWLGLDGWPIRRADLDRYFVMVAEMLGLPLREGDDEAVWRALGVTPPDLGTDVEFVLTRWLRRPNLAQMFAKDLQHNANLAVLLHASAIGFVPADEQVSGPQRIASVSLRSRKGREIEADAAHFVVATGTIEASRLMLAAARKQPALAWSNNDWIGRAFQDHLDLRAGDVTALDKKRFGDAFDNIYLHGFKYNPKLVLANDTQRSDQITNVAAMFTFESSLTEHLENLKIFLRALRTGARPPNLRLMPAHFAALARIWWPLIIRYLKDNRAFNPGDLGIGLRLHCEQRPLAESRISLDPARCDGNGVPVTVLDWKVDGRELEAIAIFSQHIAAALESSGLARVRIDPRIVQRDPSLLEAARDTNHHCGGLQMAADQKRGVVDNELTVFGTQNLSVAGAAVFPSSSFANPTFTAMALGLRLAERLARKLNG